MRSVFFMLALLASPCMAQSPNQVTLKFDDGTGVSGDLLSFENNIFRLDSSVGLVSIPADGIFCIGLACPEGTALEVASAPVKLISRDGTMQISGDVIEFTDGEYVLATDIGEMRIKADLVTCEGAGCVASPAATSTQDYVVLSDGATKLEGTLLGFEDDVYIMDIDSLGQVKISASRFTCLGDACP